MAAQKQHPCFVYGRSQTQMSGEKRAWLNKVTRNSCQSLQANAGKLRHLSPTPLLSKFFAINYSLINLPFYTIPSKLLSALLRKAWVIPRSSTWNSILINISKYTRAWQNNRTWD
jgi:hypothetical protein